MKLEYIENSFPIISIMVMMLAKMGGNKMKTYYLLGA